MNDRVALRRVRQRVDKLARQRSEFRSALAEFEQLTAEVDAAITGAASTTESDGPVESNGPVETETTANGEDSLEEGEHATGFGELRRDYQVMLHPDTGGDLGSGRTGLSASLNDALDRGDVLAVAEVLAEVSDAIPANADLAMLTIKMFALDDENRLLCQILDRFEMSPLRQMRDLISDDPDIDLADFLR